MAAYVGLNLNLRQSGSSLNKSKSISKMGNATLRKAFYFPAIVSLRFNPIIKALKDRLTKAGKAKMVMVIAAMRKLLHIVYEVLKNKTPFTVSHTQMAKQVNN